MTEKNEKRDRPSEPGSGGAAKARPTTDQSAPAGRPAKEVKAEAELLKTSGGDPLTQESD
jgi:hypothetical protein